MEDANPSFVFEIVTKEKFEKLITNLNIRKTVQSNDIPTKQVKEFGYLFSKYIARSIKRCITEGNFVNAFKKNWSSNNLWKRQKNKKIELLSHNILYIYQCGFCKGFNTHRIVLAMMEKRKVSRDKKQFCAAILTELSKAFDCICHDLLIAKSNAYGPNKKALKLIYDYLNGRSQKTRVGSLFSSELDISFGVPQGFVLGPLLFNINICDLLFFSITSDIASYADHTTPYEYDQRCDDLIK